MICKNCGYRNESGDEFCGSCGQFLEWTGVAIEEPEPTEPEPEPTETKLKPEPAQPVGVAAGRESTPDRPQRQPERPTGGEPPTEAVSTVPITPIPPRQPDVICWNCKSRNKAGRTFCLKCGERLTTGGGGNRGRLLAILLGLAAVVLLAVAAVAFFFGGAPAPTASPTAPAVSPTPPASPTASPATATPSPAANITPTPTRECSSSAEPVRTVELTRSQPQRRSGNQTAWCIRDVVFQSRQGAGVLRLTLTNPTAFPSAPDGTVEWLVAAMPEDFDEAGQYRPVIAFPPPFELVPPGTAIRLALECSTSTCNGRVTIAYDRISGR